MKYETKKPSLDQKIQKIALPILFLLFIYFIFR